MILDNISRALKDQNWLAAAIEFVIVIAGVVIGFQIQAWNESRREAALEQDTLERLTVELELSTWVAAEYLAGTAPAVEDRLELVAWLAGSDVSAPDREPLIDAIRSLTWSVAYKPPTGVYDEVVSSGRWRLIADSITREKVEAFKAKAADLEYRIATTNERFFAIRDVMFPHVKIVYAKGIGRDDLDGNFDYEIDWEGLRTNDKAIHEVNRVTSNHQFIRNLWVETHGAAIEACRAVAASAGRRCRETRPMEIDRP